MPEAWFTCRNVANDGFKDGSEEAVRISRLWVMLGARWRHHGNAERSAEAAIN